METKKTKTEEKTLPELQMELDRARRMGAMIKAIGEKAQELQAENELLKERLAALSPKGGTPETAEPEQGRHESLTPGYVFDCLAVTDVQVFPFKESPNLGHIKGFAQVVLNDQFMVRGIRIMEGENGLYVGYPNDPFYKGEGFKSIVLPITKQLKEHIENCVLEKYQAAIA